MSYEAWNQLTDANVSGAISEVYKGVPVNSFDFFITGMMLVVLIGVYNTTKSWEATAYVGVLMVLYGFARAIAHLNIISTILFIIVGAGLGLVIFKLLRKR